jgi:hypothetical protein
MTDLVITLDLDWACEAAIEETLEFFMDKKIAPTVFITHRSKAIEASMAQLEVGLHPFFGENSSHGNSITEVVKHIMALPHNLKAFRCHRFAVCNVSKQAMLEAGMQISSNVCTNLEVIRPFHDRFGLFEIPVFLEDGGYLWQKHPLEISTFLKKALANPAPKVLLIHPMHFAINTPHFDYMSDIKRSLNRESWHQLNQNRLNKLRWKGRGIRDLIIDLLDLVPDTVSLQTLYHNVLKQHDLPEQLPEQQN